MKQMTTRRGTLLKILSVLTAMMLFYLTLPSAFGVSSSRAALDPLVTKILKIGKADAILLQCGGSTMVIDAGEEEDGQEVVENLREMGVSKVDVLIITHYDKDHVGGADTVVDAFEIGRVLLPDYDGASAAYQDLLAALERKAIRPERLSEAVTFLLGSAEVLVEPPTAYWDSGSSKEVDNNCSLVTTVTHGSMRLVFAGDIEKARIEQWLETGTVRDCDFLKVPHHGEYNKALQALLEALDPEFAVICTSDKNPAEETVLQLLKDQGTEVLETRNGDVTVISSGKGLEIWQE